MFPFKPKFCELFSWIERWGPLIHFSITNLLSIYDCILKEWVNHWNC